MQINANWLLLSCKGIQKHNVPKYIASLFQSHSKQTDNSFHWMHRSYTKAIHLWKRPGLPEGSVVLIHETINEGRYRGGKKGCCKLFTDVCDSSKYTSQILQTHGFSGHLVTLCHELEDASKCPVHAVSKEIKGQVCQVCQKLKPSLSVK